MVEFHSLSALLLLMGTSRCVGFSSPHTSRTAPFARDVSPLQMASFFTEEATTYQPLFDFTDESSEAIDAFERIDDAIMGGISSSTLRALPNETYVSWCGICRVDGGGFCGFRTLPFVDPLNVGDANGFYIDCRLASDEEPQRRVWKMVTRTEASRGEEVFQSSFELPVQKKGWARIKVPFSDFVQVRGPRMVKDGKALNVTNGLYQIGLSLSKFVIAENMTELEDFRPGYFELQLKRIGLYENKKYSSTWGKVTAPSTLDKSEAQQQRPLVFKLLLPIARTLFSEEKRRRRVAMKILREQRNLTRGKAMLFGIRKRSKTQGNAKSIAKLFSIVLEDCCSSIAGLVIRYGLFYPILYSSRIIKFAKKKMSKIMDSSKEAKAE